jgi:formamidopyrimidine-DNA glycosylase
MANVFEVVIEASKMYQSIGTLVNGASEATFPSQAKNASSILVARSNNFASHRESFDVMTNFFR